MLLGVFARDRFIRCGGNICMIVLWTLLMGSYKFSASSQNKTSPRRSLLKNATKHFVAIVVCVLTVPGWALNVDALRSRSVRNVPCFVVLLWKLAKKIDISYGFGQKLTLLVNNATMYNMTLSGMSVIQAGVQRATSFMATWHCMAGRVPVVYALVSNFL